jgi:hypothetical protein
LRRMAKPSRAQRRTMGGHRWGRIIPAHATIYSDHVRLS